MMFNIVILASTCVTSAAADTRTTVNFDFAWRHRLGQTEPPQPSPPPSPPMGCTGAYAFSNYSDTQCDGLSNHQATDLKSCEEVCCNDNGCGIYQWSDENPGGGCWTGTGEESCNTNKNWAGGKRKPPYMPPAPPGPPPNGTAPETLPGYDDSKWELVQAPHDGLISFSAANKDLCPGGCSGHSYIPRYPMWYRKHFALPSNWSNSVVSVRFDGVFRECNLWLNGVNVTAHTSGYTSFTVVLPSKLLKFDGTDNVISLYVDVDKGKSGWWYEGGGIYRHVHLIRTNPVHISPNGVFTYSNISGISTTGMSANGAVLHSEATVTNAGAQTATVVVQSTLLSPTGVSIGSSNSTTSIAAGTESRLVVPPIVTGDVTLWAPRAPTLYSVQFSVFVGGVLVDSITESFGFRSLYYDSSIGMKLNNQRFKWRGFCDHDNFATVGMAVPDRIKLYRSQASRSVGGNGRRTSHNAPDPIMLDIYDRVGIAVMDENRNLGNSSTLEGQFRDMVARDRNHPSIVVWSFCNEAGCETAYQEAGGPRFQKAAYELDGSRPTLANMFTYNDLLSKTIDIQGFSHQDRQKYLDAHAAMPSKPLWASECCSCNTMRGEVQSDGPIQGEFNGDCQQGQTNATDGIDWAVGTTVWTLFDYYGEPSNGGWPYVSSTFGAFDLAGFAKSAAFWFRSQWLYGIEDSSYDKAFPTNSSTMIHIVESWQPPPPPPPPSSPKNTTFGVPCLAASNPREVITVKQVPGDSGNFTIVSDVGLCIDGSNHGTCITNLTSSQSTCYPLPFVECKPGSVGQTFSWSKAHAGAIVNAANNGCLDLDGGAGPRVGIYECNSGPNQKWNITKDSSGAPRLAQNQGGNMICLSDGDIGSGVGEHRTIHVYTNAPGVELFKDKVSMGVVSGIQLGTKGGPSYATWTGVPFSPGTITAIALDANNKTLASDSIQTAGEPSSIQLTVDVPSATTGTGTALLLDGQDIGMVRAEIVDANGLFCAQTSGINVTFSIVSGPGMIFGAHSGDPASHEPNQAPSHTTYNGLVRGVIRVTSSSATADYALRQFIDVDAPSEVDSEGSAIVVQASAPGLKSGTVSIAVSSDPSTASVLAAAAEYGNGDPVVFN